MDTHDQHIMVRTEALKIAMRFASSNMSEKTWAMSTNAEQIETLQEIYTLANLNFEYIMTGKTPI